MATIGQALTAPEAGWQRYDNTNPNITYSGAWATYAQGGLYNGNYQYTNQQGAFLSFNFTGTQLRLLGGIGTLTSYSTAASIIVDGQNYTCSDRGATAINQCLMFELLNLSHGEHNVKMSCVDSLYIGLDAIDIDAAGTLKPYSPVVVVLAPTNLTATAGDSQVTLSWNAVSGATGYSVKYSTTAGGPYTTIVSPIDSTSYINTGLTNGTTYYYVVTALNGTDESSPSNEASATPVAVVIPPTSTVNELLRVTMIDLSEREYRLATVEIDGFVKWYNSHVSTDTASYELTDIVDTSKEYLAFEKIISFKVIPLAK